MRLGAGSPEVRRWKRPEGRLEREGVWCAADAAAAGQVRLAHGGADELEVHGVGGGRDLRPAGLEEFDAAGRLDDEVHLAGAIAPEEQAPGALGAPLAGA